MRDHDAVPTPAVIYLTALPALGSTDWESERLVEALGANRAKEVMVAHAARLAGLHAVGWGTVVSWGLREGSGMGWVLGADQGSSWPW